MSWHVLKEWHARSWAWFVGHTERPHALWWLGLLAFSDALFFPLAPEIYLVAFTLAQPTRWTRYLPVAILSSVLGASVGYIVGAFLFHQFGLPLLQFYHLEPAFMTAQHLIRGHVFATMLLASFTPIPDKVFIYAGGVLGVHFVPFITGYFVGRGIRMALVVYLSARFGQQALGIIKRYLLIFSAVLVALATIYAMVHWHLLGL
jgi:membrane protein YqaA with SNARE-associated domain